MLHQGGRPVKTVCRWPAIKRPMPLTIIKLGGSLGPSPCLPRWLANIQRLSRERQALIVPGGGRFADKIRQLQQAHGFTDATGHRLALLAMCRYAACLKRLCPAVHYSRAIAPAELPAEQAGPAPLLWRPLALLRHSPQGLMPDWDHTSDSIALWLATRLNAARLYIIKSITPPGRYNRLSRFGPGGLHRQRLPAAGSPIQGKRDLP